MCYKINTKVKILQPYLFLLILASQSLHKDASYQAEQYADTKCDPPNNRGEGS